MASTAPTQPVTAGPEGTTAERGGDWLRAALGLRPETVLAGLTVVFVAIVAWWVAVDSRVVLADTGRHLLIAEQLRDAIGAGHVFAPVNNWNSYPPLVHMVGVVASTFGGGLIDGPILLQQAIFVPALAAGCLLLGRAAGSAWTGVLAFLFLLGSPIVISQSHEFMLDLPLTAMTALGAGLVLTSEKFERRGVAAAAGIVLGLGLLTKTTYAFYVAGPILIVLARGGWRRPVNVAICAALVLIVAGPWYLSHVPDLRGQARSAANGTAGGPTLARHHSGRSRTSAGTPA